MTTYLTESTSIYTNDNPSDTCNGKSILTVTLWADDERVQTFGGMLFQDESDVRAKAAAAANKWDGLTGDDVRAYDAYIRTID
jgi:hypothetical protein